MMDAIQTILAVFWPPRGRRRAPAGTPRAAQPRRAPLPVLPAGPVRVYRRSRRTEAAPVRPYVLRALEARNVLYGGEAAR